MSNLVEIRNLKKHFVSSRGFIRRQDTTVRAVDGVSLEIRAGEILGLVGESGSGKSTLAKMVMRLLSPTENSITFAGDDIFALKGTALRGLRKKLGIVYQDPASSLNPRSTIRRSLERPLQINGVPKDVAAAQIRRAMEDVNLRPELLDRYPHQLSGGQQQRVCVARAIALRPTLLVLDEPTSALDVSVQATILNLFLDLQQEYNLTYLFISHELNVVKYISDRIAVMYLGKIVEIGNVDDLYRNALHPYTIGLMLSSPMLSPRLRDRRRIVFSGEPPSLINVPSGCRLHPRCPYATEACRITEPPLVDVSDGHQVACHRAREMNGVMAQMLRERNG